MQQQQQPQPPQQEFMMHIIVGLKQAKTIGLISSSLVTCHWLIVNSLWCLISDSLSIAHWLIVGSLQFCVHIDAGDNCSGHICPVAITVYHHVINGITSEGLLTAPMFVWLSKTTSQEQSVDSCYNHGMMPKKSLNRCLSCLPQLEGKTNEKLAWVVLWERWEYANKTLSKTCLRVLWWHEKQ